MKHHQSTEYRRIGGIHEHCMVDRQKSKTNEQDSIRSLRLTAISWVNQPLLCQKFICSTVSDSHQSQIDIQLLRQKIHNKLHFHANRNNNSYYVCYVWMGRRGVGVSSVLCNRKVAGSNLPHATALRPWTSCLPIIVCEEGNGKPPHSSHPQVA